MSVPLSISSIYGAQASGARVGPEPNPDPAPVNIAGSRTASSGTQPALSWVALLGTLVALRILQEMAE